MIYLLILARMPDNARTLIVEFGLTAFVALEERVVLAAVQRSPYLRTPGSQLDYECHRCRGCLPDEA